MAKSEGSVDGIAEVPTADSDATRIPDSEEDGMTELLATVLDGIAVGPVPEDRITDGRPVADMKAEL